jgi:dTDP-4-amino-4,6-dideoxygalactose transaminase
MRRKELYDGLKTRNIYCQVHYVPVHKMPYYRGIREDQLPVAEKYYSQCLSLPMFPTLTDEEQDYVISSIRELL